MKGMLYFTHRWLGIVLCAFFALWFASGIFMMYIEYPTLTRAERLAGVETFNFSAARLTPADAVALLQAGDFSVRGQPDRNRAVPIAEPTVAVVPDHVVPGMLLGRPVYRVYPEGGAQPRMVRADTGEVLGRVSAVTATAVALGFAKRAGLLQPLASAPQLLGMIQTDQWTVSSALNPYRPLYRFALGDEAGTDLYVASATGEVVRDTHRMERLLNYPAAVAHWLYPTLIRRHAEAWSLMVQVLAGFGAVLTLTGLWMGVTRWRRRVVPGVSRIPYRGLMRWHHITGLVFGLVALTWVFSGMLSLNPGSINPSRTPTAAEAQVFSGDRAVTDGFPVPRVQTSVGDVVEVELLHYRFVPFFRVSTRDGAERMVAADASHPSRPSLHALIMQAPKLMPEAHMEDAEVLHGYDNYWHTRNPETGNKPLPIVRVKFDDAAKTWFHIDPATGQVMERSTHTNRAYRWLYGGLHSWDLWWLWQRRPLWDLVVIAFSLGGLGLSITGIIASLRHLRRRRRLATLASRCV